MLKHILLILAIAIWVFLAYSNSIENGFHYDDTTKIVNNPTLESISGLIEELKRSEPRIVSNFTFYLNYKIAPASVPLYHIFNIMFHIMNCTLIYFIVLLTLRLVGIEKNYLAFLVALFFGLHPINSEPVNYIVHGRFMTVCTLFYLLGLLFFILAFQPNRKMWLYLLLTTICWIFSTLSKEVGVTLPGALYFYYILFLTKNRKYSTIATALFIGALFLVAIYASLINIPRTVKEHILPEGMSLFDGLAIEWLTQFNIAVHYYLKLYLLPLPNLLNLDHDVWFIPYDKYGWIDKINAQTVVSLVVIVCLLIFTIWAFFRKHRLVAFSMLWLFITHSPTTLARKGELIAEYKNYLPLFGFCLIAVLIIDKLSYLLKLEKEGAIAGVLIIAGLFSFVDYERNRVWENDLTLWTDTAQKSPKKSRPKQAIGHYWLMQKDYDKAIEHAKKAIELDQLNMLAYVTLGVAYSESGKNDEAIPILSKIVEMKDKLKGLPLRTISEAYNNLGLAYDAKRDYDKALECYKKGLEAMPYYSPAMNNLGIAYFQKGNLDEAERWAKKALKEEPYSQESQVLLGLISFQKKDDQSAYNYFSKAPDRALSAVEKVVNGLEPTEKSRMQAIIKRLKDLPK